MSGLIGRARSISKRLKRRLIPAHVRFVRSGEEFLRNGEREIHQLSRFVKSGDTVLDVGANLGQYSFTLCSLVGGHGRVIALEPVPALAAYMSRAAEKLNLPLTVIACAASAREGTAQLGVPSDRGVERPAFSSLEPRPGQCSREVTVQTRRLDDITANLGPVGFMKIDVEGHELEVLRGAVETLTKSRPVLLIEIEARHSRVPVAETFKFLESQGYRGTFLDETGAERPLSEFDLDRHQTSRTDQAGTPGYVNNFFFFPR